MNNQLKQLEHRIETLERSNRNSLRFFVQYLLSPLLVVAIGMVFNWQLENDRKEFQQIKIAQSMLTTIFSDDEFKALASQRLLNEVLKDEKLKQEMGHIIGDYLKSKFERLVKDGDYESATNVYEAAKSVGGNLGQDIAANIKDRDVQTGAISKYETARGFEIAGFTALIREDFDTALSSFQAASDAYPDFHSVAEIYRLLKANKAELNKASVKTKVYRQIIEKYAWKAPANSIQRLKAKIQQSL